jgi:hypothetical protein
MSEDKPLGFIGADLPKKKDQTNESVDPAKTDKKHEMSVDVSSEEPSFDERFKKDALVENEPEVTVFEEQHSYSMSDIGRSDDTIESYQDKRNKLEAEIFRLIDQVRFAKRQILYYLCDIYKHRDAFFVGKDKGYRTNFPKYVKDTFGQKSSTIYSDTKLVVFLVKQGKEDLLRTDQPDLVTVLKRIAHAPQEYQMELLDEIGVHDRTSIANKIKEIREYGKIKISSEEKYILPDDFVDHMGMANISVEGDSVNISLSNIPKEFRQYYAQAFELFGIEHQVEMLAAFFQKCKLNYKQFFQLLDSVSENDSDEGSEADLKE